jgi:hypothetical protein
MIWFPFPNNWKIKGDYPPVGGERNTYFEGKNLRPVGRVTPCAPSWQTRKPKLKIADAR